MLLLNICTVETNPFTSRSLFAKIIKSFVNKRWFNFSLFFKVNLDSTFLNIWVMGIIQITNSNGDRLSPWNMRPLTSTFAIYFSHQRRIPRFGEEWALYVDHHGWPKMKILGFRWSKKAKTTLEAITSCEIFLSVFSSFLQWEKKLWEKLNFVL